jgi:sialate O-acetylesterase
MRTVFTLAVVLLISLSTYANITLPAILGDHMVLQQKSTVNLWGWGKPNEEIKIVGSWNPDKEYTVKVENQSCWQVEIETPKAGGPYQLALKGYNTIVINDVLIGEVWLGSGQSNMEWTTQSGIINGEEEKAKANFPEIRFFTVNTITATTPQQLVEGHWVKCTPETMFPFSAVMYFFGKELYQKLNIPIGLIHSSWGGTPIEVWTPESYIQGDRFLNENAAKLKPIPWGPHESGRAYNAMIHPLIPFKIKGALWYQGEGNTGNPYFYARAMKTLIESWRAAWGNDFSFYYVQIAPFAGYGNDNVNGAIIRDQQRKALEMTDKTGMAVISDIGDLKDIHPKNKIDVGKRLAAWALHDDYGFSDIPYSGPLYSSYEMGKDKVILHFKYSDGGLEAREEELKAFEILDENGNWISVPARINGTTVEVNTREVKSPRGIRYAFHNDSIPNLFNREGLPASCFEDMFAQ